MTPSERLPLVDPLTKAFIECMEQYGIPLIWNWCQLGTHYVLWDGRSLDYDEFQAVCKACKVDQAREGRDA